MVTEKTNTQKNQLKSLWLCLLVNLVRHKDICNHSPNGGIQKLKRNLWQLAQPHPEMAKRRKGRKNHDKNKQTKKRKQTSIWSLSPYPQTAFEEHILTCWSTQWSWQLVDFYLKKTTTIWKIRFHYPFVEGDEWCFLLAGEIKNKYDTDIIRRRYLHLCWRLNTPRTPMIRLIFLHSYSESLDKYDGWIVQGDGELRLESFLETIYYLWWH